MAFLVHAARTESELNISVYNSLQIFVRVSATPVTRGQVHRPPLQRIQYNFADGLFKHRAISLVLLRYGLPPMYHLDNGVAAPICPSLLISMQFNAFQSSESKLGSKQCPVVHRDGSPE